jgi:hypothetical protein
MLHPYQLKQKNVAWNFYTILNEDTDYFDTCYNWDKFLSVFGGVTDLIVRSLQIIQQQKHPWDAKYYDKFHISSHFHERKKWINLSHSLWLCVSTYDFHTHMNTFHYFLFISTRCSIFNSNLHDWVTELDSPRNFTSPYLHWLDHFATFP